jgi:hypothetical protein
MDVLADPLLRAWRSLASAEDALDRRDEAEVARPLSALGRLARESLLSENP